MKTEYEYNAAEIEKTMQATWEAKRAFDVETDPGKEKYYCLSMFPYPSGALHMGHVRNYTIGDVISRSMRMKGKNVLQPMGWDAFGLPAENAAIDNNTAPAQWTYQNIEAMKSQLKSLGFGYDWRREIKTCSPDYYKWEQLFFTKLYEKGLVVRKKAKVNWDPVDQTVLANEQVDADGKGWRSGAKVEQKLVDMWFIRITAYAEELLSGLNTLDHWPENVKAMQRNWIGKSEGMQFEFSILDKSSVVNVYTTRPDTIFGVTYLALAPDHPVVEELAVTRKEIREFVADCNIGSVKEEQRDTQEKVGIDTGLRALHPITGESVSVWIGNFVLSGYGTGAVMCVPAHDVRDWEFAQKYHLPVLNVLGDQDGHPKNLDDGPYTGKGYLIHSGMCNGKHSDDAVSILQSWGESTGKCKKVTRYRLRDWGVSRQRYWGTPIPMALDNESGDLIPIPQEKLPVVLPENVILEGGASPLKTSKEWSRITVDGREMTLETDTFDTFMDSSWYYARYCCAMDNTQMLNPTDADYWLPVDQYIGGIEHAIMHLLYARFFHKLMRDDGLVSSDEPFTRLLCQGMVLAESYYREDQNGKREWFNPGEVSVTRGEKGESISATAKSDGKPVLFGGVTKMGKSLNNGVDPQTLIDRFGADTVRLYIMFAAPPTSTLEWVDSAVEGMHRFVKKVWRTSLKVAKAIGDNRYALDLDGMNHEQLDLYSITQETIKLVTTDVFDRQSFNTAIAKLMTLNSEIYKYKLHSPQDLAVAEHALCALLKMLNPFAPHLCQYLWKLLGRDELENSLWPSPDLNGIQSEKDVLVAVQVNGKVRGSIAVNSNSTKKEQVIELAKGHHNVAKYLNSGIVADAIYVNGRVVNFIVKKEAVES